MKKVLMLIIVMLMAFSININLVSAAPVSGTDVGATATSSTTRITGDDCNGVFGDPSDPNQVAYYLQAVFTLFKFLGPILLIVMSIFDLVKVSAEGKQDGQLQKLGGKTLKRFIYAVIIFFLPDLINFIFGLIGLYGTCGIM